MSEGRRRLSDAEGATVTLPESLAGTTVAITGATGFIGQHLAASLVARGAVVRAILRPDTHRTAPSGTTLVRAPLEPLMLARAFADATAVVHLAGVVQAAHAHAFTDVNVAGTRAVAMAARETGARLIHVSSLAAAGPSAASAPRSEVDPPRPITAYGRSKLESEHAVERISGLDWTILRPGAVYGPGDRAMLPLFRSVQIGIVPMVGRPDAAFTFVHVSDVVRAIDAAIVRRPSRETLFVGHPRPVVARQLLETLAVVLRRSPTYITVPAPLAWAAANLCEVVARVSGWPLPLNRTRYAELCAEGFACRVDRLRERLGVTAIVELDEGLAETAEWYRQHGWLKAG